MTEYTHLIEASDATEEIIGLVMDIVDGFYQDQKIEWDDVWDRVDGAELADGTVLDVGENLAASALLKIQREVRKLRKAG